MNDDDEVMLDHVSTPQWFTPVMGTAIVATCLSLVPGAHVTPLLIAAEAAWAASVVMLIAAIAYAARSYTRERGLLRSELHNPAVAPFFGAVSMALLAVGGATLLVGPRIFGAQAAAWIDLALWVVGTTIGIAVAVTIPALQFTSHRVELHQASPTWLLPVVAPMVSAATGAALVDQFDSAVLAHALAVTSLMLWGAAGIAAALITASLWWRLAHHQHSDAATVPTLWIVLGPLGQSVTALCMLAIHAPDALPELTPLISAFAALYGIPVLGFALLWLAIAGVVAWRLTKGRLPYTMSWWSFTFPVGTCVTGAAGLASVTGAAAFGVVAWALLLLLLAGWCASAVGTTRAWHLSRAHSKHLRADEAQLSAALS